MGGLSAATADGLTLVESQELICGWIGIDELPLRVHDNHRIVHLFEEKMHSVLEQPYKLSFGIHTL